jgi:hypothetical protein
MQKLKKSQLEFSFAEEIQSECKHFMVTLGFIEEQWRFFLLSAIICVNFM